MKTSISDLTIDMGNQIIPLMEIEAATPCLVDKARTSYTTLEIRFLQIAKQVRSYGKKFMPSIGRSYGSADTYTNRPDLIMSEADIQGIYNGTNIGNMEKGYLTIFLTRRVIAKTKRYLITFGIPRGWHGFDEEPTQQEVHILCNADSQYDVRLQILPLSVDQMIPVYKACCAMELSFMERSFLLSLVGGANLCLKRARGLNHPDTGYEPLPNTPPAPLAISVEPQNVGTVLTPAKAPRRQYSMKAKAAMPKPLSKAQRYKELDKQTAAILGQKRAIARKMAELRHDELYNQDDANPPHTNNLDRNALNEILRLYGENIDLTDQLCALQSEQLILLEQHYRDHLLSEIKVLAEEADFLG